MTTSSKPDALETMLGNLRQFRDANFGVCSEQWVQLTMVGNNIAAALEAERRENASRLADEFCRGETSGIGMERAAHQKAQTERDAKIREGVKALKLVICEDEELCRADKCDHCHFVPYSEVLALLDGAE
jgi:hypothetical protein